MATYPVLAYKNVLVVVKQTAYQMYRQLKARGQAPLALRWNRLEHRDTVHRKCVEELLSILHANGCTTEVVGREELYHHHMPNHNLVIAVGGDGTTLSASHFVRGEVPLLGVNSDPDDHMPHAVVGSAASQPPPLPTEGGAGGRVSDATTSEAVAIEADTRRSVGALCACTSRTMKSVLPEVLFRDILPRPRARIRLTVTSTYNETTVAPALNDVLVAHPSPAAMSRFRVTTTTTPAAAAAADEQGVPPSTGGLVMNSRSSGLWVSTATGSTGAMAAAGGDPMDSGSRELQWRIRDEAPVGVLTPTTPEHLRVHQSVPTTTQCTAQGDVVREQALAYQSSLRSSSGLGGLVAPGTSLSVRWNSHKGACYIDGHYVVHELELGDELRFTSDAKPLLLF